MKGLVKDNGLQFASCLSWKIDGQVVLLSDKVEISDASYATLFLVAKTDFSQNPTSNYRQEIELEKYLKTLLESAKEQGYEQLKARHIKDYQRLFNRVQINLGTSSSELTTDQLLKSYDLKDGQELEVLFFQYGRYLLILNENQRAN